jgi:hypothetical protein
MVAEGFSKEGFSKDGVRDLSRLPGEFRHPKPSATALRSA